MTIDLLAVLNQYGWPTFVLLSLAVALTRRIVVMGWTYQEKAKEVEGWEKRYDDMREQAREATLSVKEVLDLVRLQPADRARKE